MPVLDFFILVYRSEEYWYARSVFTGDVAESETEEGATKNLLQSIDFAITVAVEKGFTAKQWLAAQHARAPEQKYVAMFLGVLAQHDLDRKKREAPSGQYIRNLTVAKKDAA